MPRLIIRDKYFSMVKRGFFFAHCGRGSTPAQLIASKASTGVIGILAAVRELAYAEIYAASNTAVPDSSLIAVLNVFMVKGS